MRRWKSNLRIRLCEGNAEAVVLTTEKYDKGDPIYIGLGFEMPIKNLVNKIVELSEYKGKVICDSTKPNS